MSKQQRKQKLLATINIKSVFYLLLIELGVLSNFCLASNPFLWKICNFFWEDIIHTSSHVDITVVMAIELFLLAHITAFIEIYKFIGEAGSSRRDLKEKKLEAQESLMHACPNCPTLPDHSYKEPHIYNQKISQ